LRYIIATLISTSILSAQSIYTPKDIIKCNATELKVCLKDTNKPITGKLKVAYKDGKTKKLLAFRDGIVDGEVIFYYPNGVKESIATYKDGKLHGIARDYYPSGKIEKKDRVQIW
jgi:antitoxin component YwqK of YwqJK toxin-antitoxin module